MADTERPRTWYCKIGEGHPSGPGADLPMREAIAAEYRKLTGRDPDFIFSGWGAELTEPERAVVENRPPALATAPDAARLTEALERLAAVVRSAPGFAHAEIRGMSVYGDWLAEADEALAAAAGAAREGTND